MCSQEITGSRDFVSEDMAFKMAQAVRREFNVHAWINPAAGSCMCKLIYLSDQETISKIDEFIGEEWD